MTGAGTGILPEPGSLYQHRRNGRWVLVDRTVHRRNSDHVMVYFWQISGPSYQHTLTKGASTAVLHWFLETYEFKEPAIHLLDDEP